jgi:hypothetical protein
MNASTAALVADRIEGPPKPPRKTRDIRWFLPLRRATVPLVAERAKAIIVSSRWTAIERAQVLARPAFIAGRCHSGPKRFGGVAQLV